MGQMLPYPFLRGQPLKTALLNNTIDWPKLEGEPLNEYTTPFLATMAFPALFPDGKGDLTNPCLLCNVPLTSRIQHLIKFADNIDHKFRNRYASHPRFSYWALNMLQRKRALQQNSIFLKQNPGEAHLTIKQLCEMALNSNSKQFMLKLSVPGQNGPTIVSQNTCVYKYMS